MSSAQKFLSKIPLACHAIRDKTCRGLGQGPENNP